MAEESMKIKPQAPHQYIDGELLAPSKVNRNNAYFKSAIEAVADKRFSYSVVTLPFYLGITGISQADNQGTRSYLIYAPLTMTIEQMFLNGSLASGAATVVIYDAVTGTTAPSGVANPIFTTTTTSQELSYTQGITIPAGSTYRIEITGATFTTSKLDLIMHIKTDRFMPGSSDVKQTPIFTPVTEADAINATTFASQISAMSAVVTANSNNTNAVRVEAYVFANVATGTDADLRRREVALSTSTVATGTVHTMFQHSSYASSGAVFTTVAATLGDASGTTTGLATSCAMSGVTEATATDSSPQVALTGASASNSALDYRITLVNSAATNSPKTVVWLFII
jgi:hypothetical protein